jgi:hypothetical protein
MNFRHFLTETILTPGEFSLSQSGVQQTHFTQVVVSGTAFTSRAVIWSGAFLSYGCSLALWWRAPSFPALISSVWLSRHWREGGAKHTTARKAWGPAPGYGSMCYYIHHDFCTASICIRMCCCIPIPLKHPVITSVYIYTPWDRTLWIPGGRSRNMVMQRYAVSPYLVILIIYDVRLIYIIP